MSARQSLGEQSDPTESILNTLIAACKTDTTAASDNGVSKTEVFNVAVPGSQNIQVPPPKSRRVVRKATTQRAKHNKNNRSRLRAISDRINQLRELLEEDGRSVGPSKLEILTACSRHLQTIHQHPSEDEPIPCSNGFASSLYTQLFEASEDPQVMVEMASPMSTSIVNVNKNFLRLTGWSREQLVSKPYSSISKEEPRSWNTHYRTLIDDSRVVALHMSNIRLSTVDGSEITVNVHARRLSESECSTSLTLCLSVVSVGSPGEKPQIRLQRRTDPSFPGARYESAIEPTTEPATGPNAEDMSTQTNEKT